VYQNQLNAYKMVDNSTMSGAETEARVLTKAASMLRECQAEWDVSGGDVQLTDALKYNQKIWTIFQGELARDDNPLPRQLKRNLLMLSALVDKRIFETMAYPAPEKLDMMIRINENIAAGLRGGPGG